MLNNKDPYTQPSFGFYNRAIRMVWGWVWIVLFRPSPRVFHVWRIFLLRCFGAKIGKNCAIHSSVKIWLPSNLTCEDTVAIAPGVEIYNPAQVILKSHAILSQGAYLCGASHDYTKATFPLFAKPIVIGNYAWVCARAIVMAGVEISDYSILALGSIATRSIPSYQIHAGSPAKFVKNRLIVDE